jgi:hypothetical protein
LESLAPGKVRQDRVNGQRPKAAAIFVAVDLVELDRIKVMALRLHQVRQNLVLVLPSTGSKQQWPKLQHECLLQLQQVHGQDRPTHEVVLGL